MNARPIIRALAALAATLALSACASITLAPTGQYAVGKGVHTTLSSDWNDATVLHNIRKVKLLTLDGPALNRLYVTEGLVAGESMVPPERRRERTTPVFDPAMSVTEQIEFVSGNIEALGYLNVESERPRPVTIAGHRGVRFDISAASDEGLIYKGRGQAVKANDKLYVAIYLAAEEHYFQASLASAEAAMDAVAF